MRYTLRHGYEEPHRITGEYLDGDCKGVAGEWFMEETASGETTVTFKVGIDPGAWVPGHIARTLNQQILRESVERLKTEVEQRIQGSRTGERPAVVRSRAFLASMDVRRLRRVRSVPGREETSVTWALNGLEARRYTTEHAWR